MLLLYFSSLPMFGNRYMTSLLLFIFFKVVESGGKNVEIAVMTREADLRQLDEAEIDAIVAEIEAEKAAAEAAKKAPSKGT